MSLFQTIKVFLEWPGATKWFVFAGLLFASLIEGFGVAALIPAVSVAFEPPAQASGLGGEVIALLGTYGITPSLELFFSLFIGLMVFKAGLVIAVYRYVARAVADLGVAQRAQLVDHLSRARWSLFTEQPLGVFSNVITIDVSRGCKAMQQSATVVAMLFQTLIYVFIAFFISWQVALAGILCGLVVTGLLSPFISRSRKQGKLLQVRMQELTVSLSDLLQNLKPVKAMEQQASFIDYFIKQARNFARAYRKQVTYQNTMKALKEPLGAILIVAGFYVAQLYLTLTIAEWVVMALVLYRLMSRMAGVQERLQVAVSFHASYRQVKKMTAIVEAEGEQNSGTEAPRVRDRLEIRDLSFAHASHQVFRDLNLTLPMEGLTVIMGESGCGKSTLIDLLVGFHRPQSGDIALDGTPLTEIDLRAWRRQIGYVPQEVVLFNDTLRTNLTLGDESIPQSVIEQALKDAGAWDFVQALPEGLESPMGEKGSFLSGGQRQRIGLARALVRQPKFLIFDEVTSALDKKSEEIIRARAREFAAKIPVLVVTHTDEWLNEADRAYRLTPLEPAGQKPPGSPRFDCRTAGRAARRRLKVSRPASDRRGCAGSPPPARRAPNTSCRLA